MPRSRSTGHHAQATAKNRIHRATLVCVLRVEQTVQPGVDAWQPLPQPGPSRPTARPRWFPRCGIETGRAVRASSRTRGRFPFATAGTATTGLASSESRQLSKSGRACRAKSAGPRGDLRARRQVDRPSALNKVEADMPAPGLNARECSGKRHVRTFVAIEPRDQPREMPIDVGDQFTVVQFFEKFDHVTPRKHASERLDAGAIWPVEVDAPVPCLSPDRCPVGTGRRHRRRVGRSRTQASDRRGYRCRATR